MIYRCMDPESCLVRWWPRRFRKRFLWCPRMRIGFLRETVSLAALVAFLPSALLYKRLLLDKSNYFCLLFQATSSAIWTLALGFVSLRLSPVGCLGCAYGNSSLRLHASTSPASTSPSIVNSSRRLRIARPLCSFHRERGPFGVSGNSDCLLEFRGVETGKIGCFSKENLHSAWGSYHVCQALLFTHDGKNARIQGSGGRRGRGRTGKAASGCLVEGGHGLLALGQLVERLPRVPRRVAARPAHQHVGPAVAQLEQQQPLHLVLWPAMCAWAGAGRRGHPGGRGGDGCSAGAPQATLPPPRAAGAPR